MPLSVYTPTAQLLRQSTYQTPPKIPRADPTLGPLCSDWEENLTMPQPSAHLSLNTNLTALCSGDNHMVVLLIPLRIEIFSPSGAASSWVLQRMNNCSVLSQTQVFLFEMSWSPWFSKVFQKTSITA